MLQWDIILLVTPTCACSCRLNCQAESDRLDLSLIHSWPRVLDSGADDPSAPPDAGDAGTIAAPSCPVSKRKINQCLRIRIRMFLNLPDPDLLVRGTNPAPDPSLFS
jgi:hypothetical protein